MTRMVTIASVVRMSISRSAERGAMAAMNVLRKSHVP